MLRGGSNLKASAHKSGSIFQACGGATQLGVFGHAPGNGGEKGLHVAAKRERKKGWLFIRLKDPSRSG